MIFIYNSAFIYGSSIREPAGLFNIVFQSLITCMEFIRKSRDKDPSSNKRVEYQQKSGIFCPPPLHGTAEWIFLTNDDFHSSSSGFPIRKKSLLRM